MPPWVREIMPDKVARGCQLHTSYDYPCGQESVQLQKAIFKKIISESPSIHMWGGLSIWRLSMQSHLKLGHPDTSHQTNNTLAYHSLGSMNATPFHLSLKRNSQTPVRSAFLLPASHTVQRNTLLNMQWPIRVILTGSPSARQSCAVPNTALMTSGPVECTTAGNRMLLGNQEQGWPPSPNASLGVTGIRGAEKEGRHCSLLRSTHSRSHEHAASRNVHTMKLDSQK